MPGQKLTTVPRDSGDRMLDFEAMLLHNNHLQGGFRKARRCRVCRKGLAGIMEAPAQVVTVDAETGVVKGDGGDEEADPALPPGDGGDPRGEADKLLEWFTGDKAVS